MIDLLADGPTLRQTSYAIIFPAVGALLLTWGVRRRLAWRRWDRIDDHRLLDLTPTTSENSSLRGDLGYSPPRPPSKGTALIIAGLLVFLLGVGHILSYMAASHASNAEEPVSVGAWPSAPSRPDGPGMPAQVSDSTQSAVTSGGGGI